MALKYQGNLLINSNRVVNMPNGHRIDTIAELEPNRTYTFSMHGWTGGNDWATTFEIVFSNGTHSTTSHARYSDGFYDVTVTPTHSITHLVVTNPRTKQTNWNSQINWGVLTEGTQRETAWSAPLDDPTVKVEGGYYCQQNLLG